MPAVLFDIDGTLVTFKFDVKGTRKALIQELKRSGLDTSGLDLTSPTQRIMDAARSQTLNEGGAEGFASLKGRLYSILDGFEVESSRQAAVFPGTREVLLRLRSRAVRLAVLTNSGKKAAFPVLRKGRILDCFDFVLTREDVDTMKPSPDGILEAVRRFSLPKEEVCYVGDGVLDIVAAKGAGLRVISVATGIHTASRLREGGADRVISSLEELPEVLGI
ncbi:MAG TPA: HAD family hydrolase [Nitrososphaerales archaeon]|nr:HAD family hydrolase [Nitrososphaerales archaeon]